MALNVLFPEKLEPLFEPARYKVAYGGRGGAKSWGFARALLILGKKKPLRILCARETQKSIADSVHKLLSDQIKELGFQEFYEVLKASIVGKNGTAFTFAGIRQSSIADIKSYEGCDICWVEEAHIVSKHSWEVLIPTIRKDGSEIWISFNPDLETDETYKRFALNPPSSAKVMEIGYRDNPWFPEVLKQEMADLKTRDPEAYENVYEGKCRSMGEGAYFGKVFDSNCQITQQQLAQLIKPWWKRWMSGDWGFGHYTSYYWHTRGIIGPEEAKEVLGLTLNKPISVVATYREWLGQGLSEREIGETLISLCDDRELGREKYNPSYGLAEKIKAFYFSPDAFEQSIRRSNQNSIADELGRVTMAGGLPYPIKANNARVSGWRAMYGLLANTKAAYEGRAADCIWLITDNCYELIRAIPRANKDPLKLEDILKTDKLGVDINQDALDGCRYGILCREVTDNEETQEAKNAKVLEKCPTPNDKYLYSLMLPKAGARKAFKW